MKVKTDDHKIILTDLPLLPWLFGLVFSIAGLKVAIASLLTASGSGLFGALFGSVFVLAGYYGGLSALYQKITIDRWLKTVKVRKIGLLHYSKTEFPATDIEKFFCETETDSEGSTSHTVCMTLKAGQSMVLGTALRSKAECETVIKTAQEFLKQVEFPDKYQPKYL